MQSAFEFRSGIGGTFEKHGRSVIKKDLLGMKCMYGLALSLVAGAVNAQTIVNFTAVETSGPNIGQEILGTANGSSIAVTNGSRVWSTVETGGQIGRNGGGDLGQYFFYSPTQELVITEALATSDVHTTPGPINLSDFGSATFTYTKYSNIPDQIAYQIQYAVTYAVVAVSGQVTSIGPPKISAPEIDPASTASALALLIGGCLVVRGKKIKLVASAI